MPPSNPFSGRERSSTRPSARTTTKAAPRRNLPSRLRALRGNVSGSPRVKARHASFHGQSAQAGRFGEQMVAPRSISACAKSPARRDGSKRRRQPLDLRLCRRQFRLDREQPRHHALDIAVDRHRRQIERDRADRRGGVVADPGQRAQRREVLAGKFRRAARPRLSRKRADCGRARNSRARPRRAARRRGSLRQAPRPSASATEISRNRARPSSRWSAAA